MAIDSTQPMANLLAKPMANPLVNVVNVMFHPSKPYKSHQLYAWVVGITKNIEKPDPFYSRTHLGLVYLPMSVNIPVGWILCLDVPGSYKWLVNGLQPQ